MTKWKKTLVLMTAVCLSAQVLAQTGQQDADQQREATARELAQAQREAVDVEVEMRAAETQLAEAARQIGELSSRQLRVFGGGNWDADVDFNDRPLLGITIGGSAEKGAVAGVEIVGVSPGAAAAEAGLRSGDVITRINKEALSADSSEEANRALLDFMEGVEEGDTLDVEYLRGGKVSTTEVSPRRMMRRVFRFGGPDSNFQFSMSPHAPGAPGTHFEQFAFMSGAGGWGDMEMVALTRDLGRYFGTDEGFLVVSAPEDDNLQLRDGDVIQSIDGRKPKSVSHTIRILSSYQSGEKLEIKIMRDKRRQTLKIEMPDKRSSWIGEYLAPPIESNIQIMPGRKVLRPSDRT